MGFGRIGSANLRSGLKIVLKFHAVKFRKPLFSWFDAASRAVGGGGWHDFECVVWVSLINVAMINMAGRDV